MSTLLKDLLARVEELQAQLEELHERWHDYCFKDEFVCDLISHRSIEIELEIAKTKRAIASVKLEVLA